MGFAATETQLPIDQWARIMQLNPWWTNQWGISLPKSDSVQCPHVLMQFSWQQDFMSRELIAQSISMAESMIAEQLNYWPAPKYVTDEPIQYPRPRQRDYYAGGDTARGQWKAVQVRWLKVQGGGVLARTAIDLAAAITRSDPDGDGLKELFTITVPTTVTDPREIAIYYTSADRNAEPISEAWRIRPVVVTIAAGVATIKGHASLLAMPDKQLAYDAKKLDVNDATNYITTVEVYRLYRDDSYDITASTSKQGYAMWEQACDNPPCASLVSPVCLGPRDPEIGYVWVDYTIAGCFSRAPDRLSLSYLAGQPLENGQMNRTLADAVAHLATALLPVEGCSCAAVERILAYWRESPPAAGEGLRERLTGLGSADNPFGAKRGERYAWERIKPLRKLV